MPPVQYHEGRFPPQNIEWNRIIPLIGPTSAAIARYDGLLRSLDNPQVLLSPLTTKEATLSSKIEGTQATLGEVLRFEAGDQSPELHEDKKGDIAEIINYRKAILHAEGAMASLPLGQRVIQTTHAVLMDGVRGEGMAPGTFRTMPVWIGARGTGMDSARFIPIDAHKIGSAIGAWERYCHGDAPDQLVQTAILHAEFEAIHPFLDGNGRVGRILIPLMLWQNKLLHRPLFYMSAYLEAHRDEYYDRLLAISRDHDWTSWITFFLTGLRAQAEENARKAIGIRDLYNRFKPRLIELSRSQHAILALDWIFSRPIFKSSDFVESSGIPAPTAKRLLAVMKDERLGLLTTLREGSGRRPAIYIVHELFSLIEGE